MASPDFPPSFDGSERVTPRSSIATRSRLPGLLALLGGLIFLLILPMIAEQLQYAIARGRARAEAEVALEELAQLPEGVSRLRLAAKAVAPSVVGVRVIRLVRQWDEWSPVRRGPIGALEGQGSGVIVDKDGYVITNFHVVNQAAKIVVTLSDGRTIGDVQTVGEDPASDVAVLKIEAGKLMPASWGDSDKLEVGDQVLAIGSPFGLAATVTSGIISAKERRGIPVSEALYYQDFLQTDAAVNPGNSGGPLVNLSGQIVGINTAIFGDRYQGISFAIPSRIAQEVYQRLRAGEKLSRGWLGVSMQRLTDGLAERLKLPETRGVLVAEVIEDSPAEKAGIVRGDVIVEWNGRTVNDINDLRFLVAATKVGSKVKAVVYRDGAKVELTVTVAERKSLAER